MRDYAYTGRIGSGGIVLPKLGNGPDQLFLEFALDGFRRGYRAPAIRYPIVVGRKPHVTVA